MKSFAWNPRGRLRHGQPCLECFKYKRLAPNADSHRDGTNKSLHTGTEVADASSAVNY
jgi:hypothetical protein